MLKSHFLLYFFYFPKYALDNFIQKFNVQVDESNLYDQQEGLYVAELACENDKHCIGIYDESCDQKGPFRLLGRGFMTSILTRNCIYAKKTYDGEYAF